tara:strand:- start:930 stop:1145 length:216 start_codon:yes stop_codon:yes gene_type:complete
VKIYIVVDYNECENTIFFSSKKKALEYYNDNKDEGHFEFETYDVKPNKRGIIRAMVHAAICVNSNCGSEHD